jgi:hypothetical protein
VGGLTAALRTEVKEKRTYHEDKSGKRSKESPSVTLHA